MLKRLVCIGAMLVSLAAIAAGAGDSSSAAEPSNLVPDLSDAQRWLLTNVGGKQGNAVVVLPEEGGLRILITKLKDQASRGDTGLGCLGVAAKTGKAYTLRFSAKASEAREITITSMDPDKHGESIIGHANIELKTSWQTYICPIVVMRDVTAKTRLPFFAFGDKVGTVSFRHVMLTPAEGGVAVATPGAPSRDLFPSAMARDQWTVNHKGSARGTLEQAENGLRINVTAAATDRWSFRLQHQGIAIPAGQTVTLKLSAKSSEPRKITISSQQAAPPMGELTEEAVIEVGTEWQDYTCKFTFPKGTSATNDLFPIIELGDQAGTVWLRAMSLVTD